MEIGGFQIYRFDHTLFLAHFPIGQLRLVNIEDGLGWGQFYELLNEGNVVV
jgi:hypothetical protein